MGDRRLYEVARTAGGILIDDSGLLVRPDGVVVWGAPGDDQAALHRALERWFGASTAQPR